MFIRNTQNDQVEFEDTFFALEQAPSKIVQSIPSPVVNGVASLNESRYVLEDGTYLSVFHGKAVYYHHQNGGFRPMREIASFYGQKTIILKEDWADKVDMGFLNKLMRVYDVFIPSPFTQLTPQSILFAETTFNPAVTAGGGDGNVERIDGDDTSGGVAFATIRAGNGTGVDESGSNLRVRIFPNSQTDKWYIISRAILQFNTASIDDAHIIKSAVMSVYGNSKSDTDGQMDGINVYSATPASTTAIASSDYQQCGTTAHATTITYASWSTSGFNAFTFNSSGESSVSKTGYTQMCLRESSYDGDGGSPTWSYAGGHNNLIRGDSVDGSNDPKLVVNHGLAFTPEINIM
jgi:hypothetical protein